MAYTRQLQTDPLIKSSIRCTNLGMFGQQIYLTLSSNYGHKSKTSIRRLYYRRKFKGIVRTNQFRNNYG